VTLPICPKLAPNTDITTPPDDTLEAKEEDETVVGVSWTTSKVSNVTALKATLRVSRVALALSDGKRHDMMVSLVQNEPVQAVTANRVPGDDAMLANEWPEMTKSALPVVGTQLEDEPVTTGSG
jgi:hypothetical protein